MIWTFQQIEGPPSERKTLELDGYNAPFGRPRKDPVITERIVSRIQTTRYPGSNGQTRHAFGINWEPTELKGRWMTKVNTDGDTASDVADDWTNFVKDQRTCRIAWGFVVSWTGYIEELELARESEHEIAWKMKLQIDQRDNIATRRILPSTASAADDLIDMGDFLRLSKKLLDPLVPDMAPDFLDELDNLAAALNTPAAVMNKLAGRFSDLEHASYNTLQHFRGAISDMRTALVTYRDAVVDAAVDDAILVRTCETDIAWVKYQTNLDNQAYVILDQLNLLDRKAQLAQSNDATAFCTAIPGDSWESLSIRATGGVDKVAEIRSINGARYGSRPTPGESYLIP